MARIRLTATTSEWECGLTVRDWRYVVRICNIDVTNLIAGSGANLINLLVRALWRLPTAPVSAGGVRLRTLRRSTARWATR